MPPQNLLDRIRAEYREMPGLQLTLAQAQRLFDVEGAVCERLLAALVEMGFLCVNRNGMYGRTTADEGPRSHLGKGGVEFDHDSRRAS